MNEKNHQALLNTNRIFVSWIQQPPNCKMWESVLYRFPSPDGLPYLVTTWIFFLGNKGVRKINLGFSSVELIIFFLSEIIFSMGNCYEKQWMSLLGRRNDRCLSLD